MAAHSLSLASAAFDLEVRSKLSRVTYQLPDDIADGIRLVSACELWDDIAVSKGAAASTKSAMAKSRLDTELLKRGFLRTRRITDGSSIRCSGRSRDLFLGQPIIPTFIVGWYPSTFGSILPLERS